MRMRRNFSSLRNRSCWTAHLHSRAAIRKVLGLSPASLFGSVRCDDRIRKVDHHCRIGTPSSWGSITTYAWKSDESGAPPGKPFRFKLRRSWMAWRTCGRNDHHASPWHSVAKWKKMGVRLRLHGGPTSTGQVRRSSKLWTDILAQKRRQAIQRDVSGLCNVVQPRHQDRGWGYDQYRVTLEIYHARRHDNVSSQPNRDRHCLTCLCQGRKPVRRQRDRDYYPGQERETTRKQHRQDDLWRDGPIQGGPVQSRITKTKACDPNGIRARLSYT